MNGFAEFIGGLIWLALLIAGASYIFKLVVY